MRVEVCGPALDGDEPVLGVDADRDLARMEARGLAHEVGIAHRGRADDDAGQRPCASQPSTVLMSRMPPPSCTGIVTRARMASTAAAFIGLPAKAPSRSTTCSHSKPWRSKIARLRGRIVVEHGRLIHVALDEADAAAVLEVDGGKQDHGRHLRKLAMSLRPSAWLFSG